MPPPGPRPGGRSPPRARRAARALAAITPALPPGVRVSHVASSAGDDAESSSVAWLETTTTTSRDEKEKGFARHRGSRGVGARVLRCDVVAEAADWTDEAWRREAEDSAREREASDGMRARRSGDAARTNDDALSLERYLRDDARILFRRARRLFDRGGRERRRHSRVVPLATAARRCAAVSEAAQPRPRP